MGASSVTFDAFVMFRGPALLRFAFALTGDRGLAEDLVQEALVRAYGRFSEILVEHPEAYVRRIIVTSYLSWRRRRSSKELPGLVPEDAVADGTELVLQRDLVSRILAELPRRQRAVLVLRYYEGLPDSEIADLLHCASGTVRSLAARAFATLRSHPQLADMGAPITLLREEIP